LPPEIAQLLADRAAHWNDKKALQDLFTEEQRLILGIFGSRARDHQEHLAIFEALERRDEQLAVERMRTHLEGVQDAVQKWDPEHHPVS